MFLDFYNNLSDNGKLIIIESGRPLRDQIKEVDWSQYVILANGRKVSPDYTPVDDDFLMMRRIPGSTAVIAWVAIISAVVAGIASGVSIYKAKMQQKKLRELQEAMSARDDVSNIPWLQGASNAIATGKSQPYIIGRHLFTPYLLQQSFYKISGADGINQDVYITLEGGFGPQAIRQIKADDVMLYDFGNQTTPQRGSAYRPPSGLFKYFSGINDNFIQIEQNRALGSSGSTISSDFYIKHAVEEPNVMLPWREDCEQWQATKTEEYTERVWIGDEDHGWWRNVKRTRTVTYTDGEIKTETKKFTLDPCAKNVEICIMFNGLCQYSDSGKKQSHTRNIGFRYSTNGGSSWSPLDVGGGSTSGGYYVVSWTKSSTSQLRYVKSHTFTWAQGKAAQTSGVPIMIEVTNRDKKSTAKGGAYEDAYVQWVQSEIFDAEKSKAADSFVNCKVLEDKEAAYSTIIALKLRASSENEGKLGKINVITSGAARTWNGAAWSSSKSATSNPASWLLEVLTSSIHPASQYADSEIDLASFGTLYEFCQTNGFSVDYVITQGQKKSQILEAICNVCRCMLYRNIYGKIAVAIDKEKENAVALLNAQNILGVEITKSFARRTDGIKLSWVDASSGYSQAETICMRPGVTRTADSIIREMDVQGITGYDHLMKYARYIMASETLRPKTVRVRTGAEGVYYTPYSKILMQDDSLRVGLGNATIRSVVTSGGNIVGLKLNEYIDLDDEHDFGVIINCVSDDYCSQLAKQITAPQGHSRVDEILFETPFSVDSSVIPHAGDVLSYGYLGEGGEFDSISSPYIITGIEPGENEVTLNLLDYNPDVYTTGDYGEYVPNITRKTEPYTPVIIPPPETSADVEDILSGDNMEAPDIPTGITVVATRDGLRVACNKPDTSSIKNTIAKIVWELALDGIGPEDRPDDPHWTEYSTTGYEYLIPFPGSVPYPEASDMYNWLVRCKFVSVYNKTSDYGEYKTVNTDNYGTWTVQTPSLSDGTLKLAANGRSFHIECRQPSSVYGNVRYKISIRRYDTTPADTWFCPNITANPYESEDAYKDLTASVNYLIFTSSFVQTVPLKGQSETDPKYDGTLYYYKVVAYNEAGSATAATFSMTAFPVGARDVVKAWTTSGGEKTYVPGGLKADNIYTENLAAIAAVFAQITSGGSVSDADHVWDLENDEFRVGNNRAYETSGDDRAQYIHYKEGDLSMKLRNLYLTTIGAFIKGALSVIPGNQTPEDHDLRHYLTEQASLLQRLVDNTWKTETGISWDGVETSRLYKDGTLIIGNTADGGNGGTTFGAELPSSSARVYHFDKDRLDNKGQTVLTISDLYGGIPSQLADEETEIPAVIPVDVDLHPEYKKIAPYSTVQKFLFGNYSLTLPLSGVSQFTVTFLLKYVYNENGQILLDITAGDARLRLVEYNAEPYYNTPAEGEPFYNEATAEHGELVYNEIRDAFGRAEHSSINQHEEADVNLLESDRWYHVAVVLTSTHIKLFMDTKNALTDEYEITEVASFARYTSGAQNVQLVIGENKNIIGIDELMFDPTQAMSLVDFQDFTERNIPWGELDADDGYLVVNAKDPAKVKSNCFFTKSESLLASYPVGIVIITTTDTNPGTIFGGVWIAFGQGRVLIGAGAITEGTVTTTFNAGATGGATTHTLDVSEIPGHTHSVYSGQDQGELRPYTETLPKITPAYYDSVAKPTTWLPNNNTGGGRAHNNMQPYIVVYMWKRTE